MTVELDHSDENKKNVLHKCRTFFFNYLFRSIQVKLAYNFFFFFRPLHKHREYESGEGEECTAHKGPFKAYDLSDLAGQLLRRVSTRNETVRTHRYERNEYSCTDGCRNLLHRICHC